jgi:tRNA A-37 threonylcarbamoyl transferase component Bud32
MTDVLDDRYELGVALGSGGMAEVFEAFDRSLGRRVAVKFLKADLPDPRARERFEREARTAASFTHANAVTVYDVGDDGQRPYIVMELVEGRTLADLLAEQGQLPPNAAARITDEVLAALGAAHDRGLVHRDVKPGNVLITRDGLVKLADFGIAKAASDATAGLTATGQVMGTPKYLSPEQAAGWSRALRDACRRAAVHGRHARGPRSRASAGAGAAAIRPVPRASARLARHRRASAGEGPGGALPGRHRDAHRPRWSARRGARRGDGAGDRDAHRRAPAGGPAPDPVAA